MNARPGINVTGPTFGWFNLLLATDGAQHTASQFSGTVAREGASEFPEEDTAATMNSSISDIFGTKKKWGLLRPVSYGMNGCTSQACQES